MYSRIATREGVQYLVREACKIAFKRGYAKGYRVGRAWEGKAWKKALKDWYGREQTGMEKTLKEVTGKQD